LTCSAQFVWRGAGWMSSSTTLFQFLRWPIRLRPLPPPPQPVTFFQSPSQFTRKVLLNPKPGAFRLIPKWPNSSGSPPSLIIDQVFFSVSLFFLLELPSLDQLSFARRLHVSDREAFSLTLHFFQQRHTILFAARASRARITRGPSLIECRVGSCLADHLTLDLRSRLFRPLPCKTSFSQADHPTFHPNL